MAKGWAEALPLSEWIVQALLGVFGAKGRKRTLKLSQIVVDAGLFGPDHRLYRSEIYRTG